MRLDEIVWTSNGEYWRQATVYGLHIARSKQDGGMIGQEHQNVPAGTWGLQRPNGMFDIIDPVELQCLLYEAAKRSCEPGRVEGANTEKAVPSPARALTGGA